MTAMGKMLVFLVLLLSLAFNGLVVNAYVTRTNWKKIADDNKATAQKAASAVESMGKLLETERAAATDALDQAQKERYKYEQLYAKEKEAAEGLRATLDTALTDDQKANATEIAAQVQVDSLQKQVNDLTRDVRDMRKSSDQLAIDLETANIAKTKAEVTAQQQAKLAEERREKIEKLDADMSRLKGGGSLSPLGQAFRSAPDGFRGTVQSHSGGYVSFTPGLDAGLQKNAKLSIYRLLPEPKYLGRVTVTSVEPKVAVGRFEPARGVGSGPQDQPRPGDELKPE